MDAQKLLRRALVTHSSYCEEKDIHSDFRGKERIAFIIEREMASFFLAFQVFLYVCGGILVIVGGQTSIRLQTLQPPVVAARSTL